MRRIKHKKGAGQPTEGAMALNSHRANCDMPVTGLRERFDFGETYFKEME